MCRVVRPQCGAQGVELDLKVLPGKEDSSRALSKFLVVITCSMRLTFCLWLNLEEIVLGFSQPGQHETTQWLHASKSPMLENLTICMRAQTLVKSRSY